MKMLLKGKTIWITGASSGIGEATAYALAKEGSKLILSSNEDEELELVKEKCESLGAVCYSFPFDLGDSDKIPKLVNDVLLKVNKIDILFNNGGISQRSLITETSIAIDRKIMEINYFGSILLTKLLLPHFLSNGGGHFVVTTSIAGKFGFPLRSAYSASKHALYGFYETLRAELKSKNINVTFICPGRVQTNISVNAIDKNGKPHGIMDSGQAGGVTVDYSAKKIVKAIKNNKKETYIGGKELIMVYIKRYLPGIFNRIVTRINPT